MFVKTPRRIFPRVFDINVWVSAAFNLHSLHLEVKRTSRNADHAIRSIGGRLGRCNVDKVLRQRATLLKQSGGRLTPEIAATLDVWDSQLAAAGSELIAAREELTGELAGPATTAFTRLTRLPATLSLAYQRSFAGPLLDALGAARDEDLRRGVTTVGPHRDELVIAADDLDARSRLSQGRQRAVTLALRLAAHEVVTTRSGTSPVLLLDDAFSELDEATAAALFDELPSGQAILTTAGPLPAKAIANQVLHLTAGVLTS